MVVIVVVREVGQEEMTIDLCDTEEQFKSITVLQLKEKITDSRYGRKVEEPQLVFRDKSLDEDSTLLSEYGIQHMSVIEISAYSTVYEAGAMMAVEPKKYELTGQLPERWRMELPKRRAVVNISEGGMKGKSKSEEKLADF